ncbi:hypothetical protein LBMAG48_14300 [Phycisphaerae bacterium]|nr:hypothetical protein LBMAG48_14300 [Phycisphaerae bacterium]
MKNELSTILSNLRAANEALRCADLNKWSRYFKQRDEAAIRRETWADRYGGQGRGYSTSDPVVPNPLRSLHLAMDALEDAATDSTTRARVEAMLRLPAWQVAPILDDDPQAPDGGPFDIVARPRPIPLEILDSFLASGPRYRDGKWFNRVSGAKTFSDTIRKRTTEHGGPIRTDPDSETPRYNVDDVMETFPKFRPAIVEALASGQ